MNGNGAAESAANQPIDWQRARFEPPRPARIDCASCGDTLWEVYFSIGAVEVCGRCREGFSAHVEQPVSFDRFALATLLGTGAAVLGAIGWLLITTLSGYEIGLVALAVGWAVGGAVRRGSGGLGGRPYQVVAVLLTYLAIVSTYVPEILSAFDRAESSEVSQAVEDSNATRHAGAVAMPDFPEVRDLARAMVFSLAVPFLLGSDNLIGIFIIGLALFEAWRRNRRVVLLFAGPLQVGRIPSRLDS